MTIAEQKRLLRDDIRARKQQFSSEILAEKSLFVVEKLLSEPQFCAAKTVMLYWSLPDEVQTHALIKQILGAKRILLPAVVGDVIFPKELTDFSQLQTGKFSTQEPDCEQFSDSIDLIVVPGMAFDFEGNRLGRGRGFYDRFLAKNPIVPTIGLAFDFQMVAHVPHDANDVKIGKVLF